MRHGFRSYLRDLESKLIQERLSGGPGALRRRTGQLARGWKVVVLGRDLQLVGVLFTNIPYARIHEFGGVIKPRKSRWLWIPSEKLRTPAGVFRGWDHVIWDAVFYRRSTRNPRNLVALQGMSGKARPRLIATLVPEVRIPATMGFRKLIRQGSPQLIAMLNEAVRFALDRAARG